MKKGIYRVVLLLLCLCFVISGCGTKSSSSSSGEKPTFKAAERGLDFVAYSPPTEKGAITEKMDDAYKKMAEAGFTKALALREGCSYEEGTDVYDTIKRRSVYAEEAALKALDYAEKYGIKYYVRDWSFYGLSRDFADELNTFEKMEKVISNMFSTENKYINHPAYAGNFGFDEPTYDELDGIAWMCQLYNKYIEKNSTNGGEITINLNPIHVTFTTGQTYAEYIDRYIEIIAPYTGYISYDCYPFMSNGTENYIKDLYYRNMELVATKAKEADIEFRGFVQSCGDFTGMRQLNNINDLRWEIYSCLAFGMRQIAYYQYSSGVDETDATDSDGYCLYNYKNDSYTWLYDAAKIVNNEVLNFEDAYDAYAWDGCMYLMPNEMIDNQVLSNLVDNVESTDRMSFVSATNDVFAGIFKAKDEDFSAQDAFIVVNATDPSQNLDNTVKLQFNNATKLLMYRKGEEVVVDLAEDGTYILYLEPGEGRFIIPF